MNRILKTMFALPLLVVFLGILPAVVGAQSFTEDFEALTDGDLNGQGGWVSVDTDMDVLTSGTCYEGSKCAHATSPDTEVVNNDTGLDLESTSDLWILSSRMRNAAATGKIEMAVGTSSIVGASSGIIPIGPTGALCMLGLDGSNNVRLTGENGSTHESLGVFSVDTWYFLELELDFAADTCRGRIDQGSWSSTVPMNPRLGSVDFVHISMGNASGFSKFLDDIELASAGASGDFSDYATTTRITAVNNPTDYETEAGPNVEFDYDFYFNSALDYGIIDYATIELVDYNAGLTLSTATTSIVASGNNNYTVTYTLVDGHTYGWRGVLGGSKFVRSEWEYFCVGSCQSQELNGWEPSLGGWTFIEQINDTQDLYEQFSSGNVSTSSMIASTTGVVEKVYNELMGIWPLSLVGDMKNAISGLESTATGTVSSINLEFGGSDTFGLSTTTTISLASVYSSHAIIGTMRSILAMALHVILGLGLLKFISFLWGRGDPRD